MARIAVEAEVCTIVEKKPGSYHVIAKSAIWVLGFTTTESPNTRTVIHLEGERPDNEMSKDVYATVMAHPHIGIAPRERRRYKYAELTEASWRPSSKSLDELWASRRQRR